MAAARPCLQLDGCQPEREPLRFDVQLRGAPDDVVRLVQHIQDVAGRLLFRWRAFPLQLPPAASAQPAPAPRDLFVAPAFDELDAVAVDGRGATRRLSGRQLDAVRERGEFEVDSINFPGQVHRWRLSPLLQKGSERTRDDLLADLALALRFLVVTARGRISSHFLSVANAFHAWVEGLLKLLDMLIGVPSLQAHNIEAKIREERCRYLVAELVCRHEFEESLEILCGFVRRQLRRAATEKFEVLREASRTPVPIPYLFLTPKDFELDLRLFNRDIMKKALPFLVSILERETRGWFLHFRERLISELRSKKLPDEEIEKEVNAAVMSEYLQRVYSSVLAHPGLQALGEGIPELLVRQAQSVVLMHRAVEHVQQKLAKTKESLRKRIETMYPVMSRIQPWMRDKLRNAEAHFIEECQWSAHEEALALCSKMNLHQTVYFLNRDLSFMRDREPVLQKELRKVKTPTRSFQWLTQIWFPSNWIVRRSFQGQSEVIPTVQCTTATSITTPRSDPSQPVFLVEKEVVRTTSTRWPLWRWANYCHRTWSWTWNAMFFFGVVVPWCSPVGLRALFCTEPFMPDLELSQVNGTLFPRKSSITPTLCSRLLALWRHISKSRTHFETEPDTGFIGKGFTRHVNRIWNYLVKGLLGTLATILIFPVICLSVSLCSLAIAATAFIWMPVVTLCLHIFMALVYDMDSPDKTRNQYFVILEAVLWNIGVQGCFQPALALLVACVVCPLVSLTVLTAGILRYWLRLLWDSTVFHLIIKKRGRIPASNSFVVKRVAGPGLNSNYFYQIKPEQALAAFEAKLELDELAAFQHEMEQLIRQPIRDFSQFVEACFGPFSAQLAKVGQYLTLEKEVQDLITALHEKLERRRRDLQTGLSVGMRSKIKLTTVDLKIAIQQAALMLERFYPSHVLQRLSTSEEEFWEGRGLTVGDWAGLAGCMYTDIFSLDFLTPLDDSDTKFRLEAHQSVDLSRYTDMIRSVELGTAAPDLLGPVYAPRGNIQVHSPYLEVSAFNPRSRASVTGRKQEKRTGDSSTEVQINHARRRRQTLTTSDPTSTLWQPWKRKCRSFGAEKLSIPLPVPHPVHIAITIHNRDTEDPVPLDSELCQNILRAVEEAQCDSATSAEEEASDVARFRGGNGDSVDSRSSGGEAGGGYSWRSSDWSARRRNGSGSVKVDLASPEDVTLDTDTSRAAFSTYGTTV